MQFIQIDETVLEDFEKSNRDCPTLPSESLENQKLIGVTCPNCGGVLQGRKCKLFCTRRGCGYVVTCSEW